MIVAASLALLVAAGAPPLPPLACGATLYVPPPIFDLQGNPVEPLPPEVAVAPAGTPLDEVQQRANNALVNRICLLPDRSACAPLRASIASGGVGARDGQVCAMAVITKIDVARWRTSLGADLDPLLRVAVQKLLPSAVKAVAIDDIYDGNIPGGERAEWLRTRCRAALGAIGVGVVDPQKGWNGDGLPKNTQRVMRCRLAERTDVDKQVPVVDMTWEARGPDGVWHSAQPITFPAAVAPSAPKGEANVATPNAHVHVRVDTREGGSLCAGDRTTLAIRNDASKAMHVRVLDVDSAGNVLVLFPNEERTDDMVKPKSALTLNDAGFEVIGDPGDRERYIVLGAASIDGLGRFAKAKGTCRFHPDEAGRIKGGHGFSNVEEIDDDGFTLLDPTSCKATAAPHRSAGDAMGLEEVPWCD